MWHARCAVNDAALLPMPTFQRDIAVPAHICARPPFAPAGQIGFSMVCAATKIIDAASMWNSARRRQATMGDHTHWRWPMRLSTLPLRSNIAWVCSVRVHSCGCTCVWWRGGGIVNGAVCQRCNASPFGLVAEHLACNHRLLSCMPQL